MNVNFNNARKQAIYSYESLVKKLNENISENKEKGNENEYGETIISISPEEIQKDMDGLRTFIGMIAMVYLEGENDFKDVYQEVFPDKSSQVMTLFNNEED